MCSKRQGQQSSEIYLSSKIEPKPEIEMPLHTAKYQLS